jgi:proline iminopeptidase
MPLIPVNDTRLHVETLGHGPAMLMMHGGLGLDQTSLRPWHDELADQLQLVYYDHRLNGRSSREGTANHDIWQRDAAALLDTLGIERSVIFGHSYGSWLALGFALRYPERVAGLVLAGTSPAFDHLDEVVAIAQARNPEAAAKLVAGLGTPPETDEQLERAWHDILPLYFYGPPRPDVLANVLPSARAFTLGMQCLAGFSVVDELPRLKAPILILNGAADHITPISQARRLASLAPNATLVELEKSSHFPFVEENARYIDEIRRWLGRVA